MCQFWCSIIQGIFAQLTGGHLPWVYVHCSIYIEICHEVCQVWCSGIQGNYA